MVGGGKGERNIYRERERERCCINLFLIIFINYKLAAMLCYGNKIDRVQAHSFLVVCCADAGQDR